MNWPGIVERERATQLHTLFMQSQRAIERENGEGSKYLCVTSKHFSISNERDQRVQAAIRTEIENERNKEGKIIINNECAKMVSLDLE